MYNTIYIYNTINKYLYIYICMYTHICICIYVYNISVKFKFPSNLPHLCRSSEAAGCHPGHPHGGPLRSARRACHPLGASASQGWCRLFLRDVVVGCRWAIFCEYFMMLKAA